MDIRVLGFLLTVPAVPWCRRKWLMRQAMRRMGDTATSANTAAIGDRLDTDILGAQRAGLSTLLVLTGITSAEQAATDPIRADYVFDSIREITQALQEPLPKV